MSESSRIRNAGPRAVGLQPLDGVALADELVALRLDQLVVADLRLELGDRRRESPGSARCIVVDLRDLRAVWNTMTPTSADGQHDRADEQLALPLLAALAPP